MHLVTRSQPLPVIAVHEGGDEVDCRLMSDRELINLVSDAAGVIFATEGDGPLPHAANSLKNILSGYHFGSRRPRFYEDDFDEIDEALHDATRTLRGSGRIPVAGTTVRHGPCGPETFALVLVVEQSISACRSRFDFSAVEDSSASHL